MSKLRIAITGCEELLFLRFLFPLPRPQKKRTAVLSFFHTKRPSLPGLFYFSFLERICRRHGAAQAFLFSGSCSPA